MELPAGYVTDVKIFGLPAPAVLYVERTDRGWRQCKASRWIYPNRMPSTIGISAPQPKIASLALQADLEVVRDQQIVGPQDQGPLLPGKEVVVISGDEGVWGPIDDFLADVSRGLVSSMSVIDLTGDDDDADIVPSGQGTSAQRLNSLTNSSSCFSIHSFYPIVLRSCLCQPVTLSPRMLTQMSIPTTSTRHS